MLTVVSLVALFLQGAQTPPKPFKATAQLSVPFTLGFQEVVNGTNEKLDTGTLRTLAISSARVGATYPNTSENVTAGAGEKLLIVRGTLTNPSVVELSLSSSSFLTIRFWDGKGKGEFKYVGIYDPQTHNLVHSNLRKGQSTAFDCVVRIPSAFDPFQIGFYYQNRAKIAWYDFKTKLGAMSSTFSPDGFTLSDRAQAAKDRSFDFDIFRMKVLGASEPSSIGGVAKGEQPLCVVSAEVTNTMLLPARWGWQYVTPELVMKDGSILTGSRDMIDKATDKTWSGDLPVGATMTAQFVFRPSKGQIPTAFRLTMSQSKRTIEVPL
ncbi:MAG: hypothetical protein JWN14_4928 [Chthonomonadales bacterium]|nr:hypothetical protein [Chthonomonadales bacterium]